jgi:hypothetical protein
MRTYVILVPTLCTLISGCSVPIERPAPDPRHEIDRALDGALALTLPRAVVSGAAVSVKSLPRFWPAAEWEEPGDYDVRVTELRVEEVHSIDVDIAGRVAVQSTLQIFDAPGCPWDKHAEVRLNCNIDAVDSSLPVGEAGIVVVGFRPDDLDGHPAAGLPFSIAAFVGTGASVRGVLEGKAGPARMTHEVVPQLATSSLPAANLGIREDRAR